LRERGFRNPARTTRQWKGTLAPRKWNGVVRSVFTNREPQNIGDGDQRGHGRTVLSGGIRRAEGAVGDGKTGIPQGDEAHLGAADPSSWPPAITGSRTKQYSRLRRREAATARPDTHWAARLGSDPVKESETLAEITVAQRRKKGVNKPKNADCPAVPAKLEQQSAEIDATDVPASHDSSSLAPPQVEVRDSISPTERLQSKEKPSATGVPASQDSSSLAPPQLEVRDVISPTEQLRSKEKPKSILEELFPEHTEALSPSPSSPSTTPPLELDPAALGLQQGVPWQPLAPPAAEQPFLHPDHQTRASATIDPHTLRQRLAATVLVIECASPTLSLSDFIRLSPRGEHIEGWTSGIMRVIPARDPETLARQSHYFLLFSTAAAAAAYRDNITRLHTLSKRWTPTSPLSRQPPPPGMVVDGEDVSALVNAFTILPSCQKYLFSHVMMKPYRPAVARMIETGGYHPLITPQADRQGENLVLLSLDRGMMNAFELGVAIGLDGKERNLQWRLEGSEEDIVLLGSRSDPKRVQQEEEEEEEEEGDGQRRERREKKDVKRPPRFIVKFKDTVEARRFVRAWHSRIFEGQVLERLAKLGNGEKAQVSAEILW
jgi:hypothetical protein